MGRTICTWVQREAPAVAGQSRRMLPRQGEATAGTTREARAKGDEDLALPALVLREDSNLKLVPEPGRVRVAREVLEASKLGDRIRILGGEATLSSDLAKVLAASRMLDRTCVLEDERLAVQPAAVHKGDGPLRAHPRSRAGARSGRTDGGRAGAA